MILPDHLKSEIEKYCVIKGIQLIGGRIPEQYVREIQDFINFQMRKSRQTTKRIEEENSVKIAPVIQNIMGGVLESPIEHYFYMELERNSLAEFCRPQFEIGKYRTDFAFPIARLAVECDGQDYHYATQEQIERDQKRDKYFALKGWRIIRFEGVAIRRNINLCMQTIKDILNPYIQT